MSLSADAPEASYEIRVAEQEDAPAVFDFMVKFFYPDEPLNAYLKRIPSDISQVGALSNLGNGLSLIAVSKGDGSILGIAVNQEVRPDMAEKCLERAKAYEASYPGYSKLINLLYLVRSKADVWYKREGIRTFYIEYLGVHRETRGQNIGAVLTRSSVELAGQKGYNLVTVACTSRFSASVMGKLGFECASAIEYSSYVDSVGQPVFSPPAPHTQCAVYVRRL